MKIKSAVILPREEAQRLACQLKRHEGLRLEAYLDSQGLLTIGYGHNCQAWPVPGIRKAGDAITIEQAEFLFKADLELAEGQAVRAMPWMDILNYPRRAVLINMVFNMGVGSVHSGRGLMGFRRMLAAVQAGRYELAAEEMLNSRWAEQVGRRAQELAGQMRTGFWPEAVLNAALNFAKEGMQPLNKVATPVSAAEKNVTLENAQSASALNLPADEKTKPSVCGSEIPPEILARLRAVPRPSEIDAIQVETGTAQAKVMAGSGSPHLDAELTAAVPPTCGAKAGESNNGQSGAVHV